MDVWLKEGTLKLKQLSSSTSNAGGNEEAKCRDISKVRMDSLFVWLPQEREMNCQKCRNLRQNAVAQHKE
jgi:hypothetical protein